MALSRRSRVFSISMPPEMAFRAEAVAKAQNRTISELMREAFRVYEEHRVSAFLDKPSEYPSAHNSRGYTAEDVSRIVAEVRAEMCAEQERVKCAS